MYGDHNDGGSWCGHHKDPQDYRHKNLPRGKDLTSSDLRVDLTSVLAIYSSNSDKLANHGSSQVNKSFNEMVASEAPKSHHFSSSESIPQRVAAAVC